MELLHIASQRRLFLEKVILTIGAGFILLYYSSFRELLIYVVLYMLVTVVVLKIQKRPILRQKK